MDIDQGDATTVTFSDQVSSIEDPLSLGDHNPQYHLRRYLGEESDPKSLVDGTSLEAGSWDTPLSILVSELELTTLTPTAIDSWYLYSSTGEASFGFGPILIDLGSAWDGSILSLQIPDGTKFGLLAQSIGSDVIDLFLGSSGNSIFGQEFSRASFSEGTFDLFGFDQASGTTIALSAMVVSEVRTFTAGPAPVPLQGSLIFLISGLSLILFGKSRKNSH